MSNNHPVDPGASADLDFVPKCWRCGLVVEAGAATCPHCAARLLTVPAMPAKGAGLSSLGDSLKLLFWTYGLLLVTGIIHAFVLRSSIDFDVPLDHVLRARLFTQILVFEGVDTLIIAVALALSWGRAPRDLPPQYTRLTAWIVSLPLLAGLLTLNLGYHWALRQLLHIPLISDKLMNQLDAVGVLAICVQPALVEEAYFRLFALDCLRRVTGRHAAVWISATMFGFVHVADMASIPYLIVVGASLAYLRLASGTLLLPILLHFVHNLVVMLLDGWVQ